MLLNPCPEVIKNFAGSHVQQALSIPEPYGQFQIPPPKNCEAGANLRGYRFLQRSGAQKMRFVIPT